MSAEETHPVFDFRKPSNGADQLVYHLEKTVFFVGFMGAGKTSVARKLARNAGASAIDMDRYIERRCDMKISDIFATAGEDGFRAIETDVLRELSCGDPCLVSCGGGVVLSEENRQLLKRGGFVIYLKVTASEAASRISNWSARPLFSDLERAERIIDDRLPLYEEVADIVIDTAGRGTGSLSREVFKRLKDAGVLVQGTSG